MTYPDRVVCTCLNRNSIRSQRLNKRRKFPSIAIQHRWFSAVFFPLLTDLLYLYPMLYALQELLTTCAEITVLGLADRWFLVGLAQACCNLVDSGTVFLCNLP